MKTISSILILIILSSFSIEEVKTITGTVTDENQSPLSGVVVTVKGTSTSTSTNQQGHYSIQASTNDQLTFSLNGYAQRTIKVGKSSVIDIELVWEIIEYPDEDFAEAEEVIFSPKMEYRKKMKATGAVQRSSNVSQMGFGAAYDIAQPNFNTEEYDYINENIFKIAKTAPLSTFSIDVDAASYSNVRRMIQSGQKPYADAVRIEEMINYFSYDYKNPTGEHPFSINTEVSNAPWNPQHQLVHVGIQGKKLDTETRVNSNLVFLIDVSGSMSDQNKLPLLKSSMKLLVNNLSSNDRIAIVAYAGAAGLVLPSTPASDKPTIFKALERLEAGGSTAGGAGIQLAYKVAEENLIKEGNNRVILATDGDFNTGISSTSEMVRMIEVKRKGGVYLTITGFGMGNYKDGRMEQISNAGNGNYYYIDSYKEANKVFGQEMQATLFTIAKDVKIQVEFNPNHVQAYRLIGYENRKLNDEDFNNDKIDAGELGAGHTVTALYEIIPTGIESEFVQPVNELKYQSTSPVGVSKELMTVNMRYKPIGKEESVLLSHTIKSKGSSINQASNNFRFSAAVAQFGMLIRESKFKQGATLANTLVLARGAMGRDELGYRNELVDMIRNYGAITGEQLN